MAQTCDLRRGCIFRLAPYVVETLTVEGDWVPANAQHVEHVTMYAAFAYAVDAARDGAPKRIRAAGWPFGEAVYLSRAGV